jgi:hypothetical protein
LCKLKETYNLITTLKGLSGYTWDKEKGINAEREDPAWKAYIQVRGNAFRSV